MSNRGQLGAAWGFCAATTTKGLLEGVGFKTQIVVAAGIAKVVGCITRLTWAGRGTKGFRAFGFGLHLRFGSFRVGSSVMTRWSSIVGL